MLDQSKEVKLRTEVRWWLNAVVVEKRIDLDKGNRRSVMDPKRVAVSVWQE